MNTWIVIYLLGVMASTIGPLPYDKNECARRAAEKQTEVAQTFILKNLANNPDMVIEGKRITIDDVKIVCVVSDKRPTESKL